MFAVLCFHFPELLTSKEFRAVYSEDQDEWPEKYGVTKLETVPRSTVAQHVMPFLGGREYDEHVD